MKRSSQILDTAEFILSSSRANHTEKALAECILMLVNEIVDLERSVKANSLVDVTVTENIETVEAESNVTGAVINFL